MRVLTLILMCLVLGLGGCGGGAPVGNAPPGDSAPPPAVPSANAGKTTKPAGQTGTDTKGCEGCTTGKGDPKSGSS